MAKAKPCTVHVYRPSGHRLCTLDLPSMSAKTAINKAKRRVYRMGHLAHLFTFVPIMKEV